MIEVQFTMALHQFLCCITVMTILLSRGCHSQQPACGRAVKNSRILGGEDATPGSWPWHAIVVTYGPYGYSQCGGSLITNQWVLTTARCLYSSSYNTVVHLGRYNQSDLNPNEVTRKVEDIVCYSQRPQYASYSKYENDICLLKLSEPVNFTDYIQPICLASENSTFYNGTSSWVTGFGYGDGYLYPNILQELNVPILGNNECRCYFGNYYYYYYYHPPITENVTCTWPTVGWKGPCQGDQGEPLMVKAGSVWVQIGITTYSNCAGPSIYTRVSQYQKWISDTVTGTPPGFVTFTFPETSNDLNFTCPPAIIPSPFYEGLPPDYSSPVPDYSSPVPDSSPTPVPDYSSPTPVPDYSSPVPDSSPTPVPDYSSPVPDYSSPVPDYSSPVPDSFSFFPTLDNSLFGSSENMIHFTHFTSLCVIAVLLHLFVGSGGM